jgi:hypothetical protein
MNLGDRLGDRRLALDREFRAKDPQRIERVIGFLLWIALLLTIFGIGAP